jgi:hypothetical protein
MTHPQAGRFFLPYCIDRQPDGRYAVLNRDYKPVGMNLPRKEFVKYEEHPCLVRLPGLTPAKAAQLSAAGDGALARVYLYSDATSPLLSDANWLAYSKRLQLLATLQQEE